MTRTPLLLALCAVAGASAAQTADRASASSELLSDARTTGVHWDSLDVWHPVFLQTQTAEIEAARDSLARVQADLDETASALEAARLALAIAQAHTPDTVYVPTEGDSDPALVARLDSLQGLLDDSRALVAWRDLQLNAANSRTDAANRNNERLASLLATTREALTAERDAAIARAEAAERDAESGGDPARELALETALDAARDSLREAQEERGTLYDDLLLTRQLAERLRTRLEAETAARAGERAERDAARTDNARLASELADAEAETGALREALAASDAESEALTARIAAARAALRD